MMTLITLFEFCDKTKPKEIPPRMKPDVKIKPSPKKKTKEIVHPPSEGLPEDADYIAGSWRSHPKRYVVTWTSLG